MRADGEHWPGDLDAFAAAAASLSTRAETAAFVARLKDDLARTAATGKMRHSTLISMRFKGDWPRRR